MNTTRIPTPARRAVAALAMATLAFAVTSAQQKADNAERNGWSPYAIGLWGDLPYSAAQEQIGVPNMIADMNAQRLAFTVHDGDLKQGSGSPCDAQLYLRSLGYFNALEAPAMFTPGDNDWTDCDRASNGGYPSLDRLDEERRLFFSTSYSLGQRQLPQEVQTAPLCLDFFRRMVPCVENRRWDVRGVTYATMNIQGSCNNLCDDQPDPAEWAARNNAAIVWMRQTFAHAAAAGSAAVMLISQANPGWDLSDPTRAATRNPSTLVQTSAGPDGFRDFLLALREEVVRFRRPVSYVHGDSHYFRVDKPFLDGNGRRLENFTRVETFGNNPANGTNDVQWVRVNVDAGTRDVFSYEAQIVPSNRVAVPAP
jgi:hypothetical protein